MPKRTLTLTVVAKLSGNKENLDILNREYNEFQKFLFGNNEANVYSATKQQGRRTYGKVKASKEYPLVIRKDVVKLRQLDSKTSEVKIPVYGIRGGVKLIARHREFDFSEVELLGSKIVRSDGEFFYHLSVRMSVDLKETYNNVLAIDIGSRWLATVVSTFSAPKFFGKEIREVRGKYFYLRRNGIKVGNKERNKIHDLVNKIADAIAKLAEENNAIIVVGDLHGVRKGKRKHRKANRKIHSMPSYLFLTQLEVAAARKGIAVIRVSEYNTSRMCSNCGSLDTKRPNQSTFICNSCGYTVNADINGARNILRRGVGYMLASGAAVGRPEEVGGPFRLPQPGSEPALDLAQRSSCDEQEAAGF